ncbi:MAG: GTP-binding protein [Variibacter sp.]|nr:GTP-binding protein [Variibacter sp.]
MSVADLFPSATLGPFGRRLRHARGGKIPVTVLTGFLGAGKTTLLRTFLGRPEGANTAVVVTEFGEVGVDDALVRASADETVLLGNGCVCCSTRSDLQVALRGLIADRDRGQIPHFRRVVIETSGLADPGPVLQTFATDRALGGEFHLELAVTVADAVTGAETLSWSSEARKQVILADRLIVTKTDIAAADQTTRLMERLRELNPRAEIATAVGGDVAPALLTEAAAPLLGGIEHEPVARGFVAEAEHSDDIASFVLRPEAPMPWAVFARAMDVLTTLRGPDLLRVKGFVAVAGCAGPVLVQFVQHLADPPVELEQWPDGQAGTRIVFITRKLPERVVRELFAAVSAVANAGE